MERTMNRMLVAIICLFVMIGSAAAYTLAMGEHETVTIGGDGLAIDDNVYSAGGNVRVTAPVNGDLIVFGGDVEVRAPVRGDILIGGGHVTILDAVGGDVRTGGGKVDIRGNVSGEVVALGGEVSVGPTAVIDGELVAFCGELDMDGIVRGDLTANAGAVRLGGKVLANAKIGAGDFDISPDAIIGGNLVYSAEDAPGNLDRVRGSVERVEHMDENLPFDFDDSDLAHNLPFVGGILAIGAMVLFVLTIMFVVASLAFGLAVVHWGGPFLDRTSEAIMDEPLYTGAIGFGVLIGVPIGLILLLITIVGIPFSIMGGFLFVAALFLTTVVISVLIGEQALPEKNRYVQFLGGWVIFTVLRWLPILGEWISLLGMIVGLGAMVTVALSWDQGNGSSDEEIVDRRRRRTVRKAPSEEEDEDIEVVSLRTEDVKKKTVKKKAIKDKTEDKDDERTKVCPYCESSILHRCVRCPKCGGDLKKAIED
ncbi:MAG: hypothetical protein QF415_06655 [Candidatus Undinarchaeales archaeon]|nr:hypothetical protein [Candidatus Undinarchaeales archaeon]MDP7492676.1 hypothetical protein [Candidatus Undinarchaeales archaeon]